MRRLCAVLACALGVIGLVSGCGGSSHPKIGPTTGLSLATVKHLNKIDTSKTLAECKQNASNPGLPATVKPLINTQCEYIKTGNNAGLHVVDRQICRAEAALQPEPERTTMLAQCKQL
ncbi:MAG TPA: hypothetical protein VIJ20_12195 [Solirubrobacteraceae bacterium]